jgi:DNA-binding winged helix-turn-helix (wHTH) protein
VAPASRLDTIRILRVVWGFDMSEAHPSVFGAFSIDIEKRLLFREGQRVPIRSKIFDLLLYLVHNQERVVTREELLAQIWPDSHVQEASLTVAMSTLRGILGEPANEHQYIATIPGRGYKFVSHVEDPAANSNGAGADRTELKTPANSGPPVSLVLLPFSTIGRLRNRLLMQVGIVDALVVHLTKLKHLHVIPTTSVHSLLELVRSLKNEHRLAGIDYLLEGHIQGTDHGMRVSAQILAPESAKVVWATTFDIAGTDILRLEDAIARKLASHVSRAIKNNILVPTDDSLAHDPNRPLVNPASSPSRAGVNAGRSRMTRFGTRRRRRWGRPAAGSIWARAFFL